MTSAVALAPADKGVAADKPNTGVSIEWLLVDQFPMTLGRVLERGRLAPLAVSLHGHHQLPRPMVGPYPIRFFIDLSSCYPGSGLPDPAHSPTDLVDAGSQASDTPRRG